MRNKIKSSRFLKNLKEYKLIPQECWRLSKKSHIIKADWNESAIPPSPKVIRAITNFVKKSPLNWYPDIEAINLRQVLSNYTKLPIEYIQVFNGSDAALEYIARAFLEPKDEVLIRVPTYDNFRVYVESCGAKVKNVLCSSSFVTEEDKILDAVSKKTKIIYIVNPNNPTGAICSKNQVQKVLKNAPKSLLIVDEAYYEYYGKTMSNLVTRYSNLIITRSFSKAFSLAGLRCGYILTSPENIKIINKIRVGKNVNSLAQVAAQAALEDIDYTRQHVKEIKEVKKWLVDRLINMGIKTISSPSNFILLKVKNPTDFVEYLKKHRIFIRDRSHQPQLEQFVRITVGTKDQAKRIIEVISFFLSQELS